MAAAGREEPPLVLEAVAEEAAAAAASAGFRLTAVRREPAVRLQHGASGLEPLAWSEDHRVSVSTARSIAVLEQLSDVHSGGQDMVIHRTAVPAPATACTLKVSARHGLGSGYKCLKEEAAGKGSQGGFGSDIRRNSLAGRVTGARDGLPRVVVEPAVRGGVQGTAGRAAQCPGLGDTAGVGHSMDSMISEAFLALMVLWFFLMVPSNKTRETGIN